MHVRYWFDCIVSQGRPAIAGFRRLGGALPLPALLASLLSFPTTGHAWLYMKRVLFLSHSAYGVPEVDYHPVADMDRDGLVEMAYTTGNVHRPTDPIRWEYGRFLPFNRWQLLYADTLGPWPPPPPGGLDPGSFCPFAMGDADHDGLNEILGSVLVPFYDSSGSLRDSDFICTMEQRSPTGVPDTITWLWVVSIGSTVGIPQLPGSLDGDSLDDILTYERTDSFRYVVLENRGDNTYTPSWTSREWVGGPSFAFGDCDRDGRIEFMSGDGSGMEKFWETVGDDQYACVFEGHVPAGNGHLDNFLGRDVDQNGRPEFFQTLSRFVGGKRFYLYMWESDADNHYVPTLVDSVTGLYLDAGRSMCGDLDGDGVDEVVWNTCWDIRIFKADSGQALRCVSTWPNDHDPTHSYQATVNIADVNCDGYNEVLFACNSKLSVLEVEAIQVLEPNQRVDYNPGDTCRIKWRIIVPPECDSVSLFLRTDTTYALDTLAHGLVPDDTPYVWVVPDIQTDSAWVMAIAYGPGRQYDESNNPFRIVPTGVVGPRIAPPRQWALSVSPNPARGAFSVRYDVPENGGQSPGAPASDSARYSPRFRVGMYDVDGRLVKPLADGDVVAGRYEARLAPETLPVGIYFVRLDAGAMHLSRKVVVTR